MKMTSNPSIYRQLIDALQIGWKRVAIAFATTRTTLFSLRLQLYTQSCHNRQ